jgi:hypothetical protein
VPWLRAVARRNLALAFPKAQLNHMQTSARQRVQTSLITVTNQTVETSIKGKWIEVPAVVINEIPVTFRGKWLKTATIHEEQWSAKALQDPEPCVRALKRERLDGRRADIFTFSQRLPATAPNHAYPKEWASLAAIRITSFKEWWEALPQETRKNVRRAEKRGVVVKVKDLDDDLIQGIAQVNNESPFRQRVPNVHYGKSFAQVKKDQSSYLDRSEFIAAYFEEEMIGVMKLVYSEAVAGILQFHLKPSHQDKRPANALIAKAVEVCEAKGISFLVYGLYNYGNKQDSPLREFKTRNGFQETLVPRFYIPLTVRGALCVKLGLHRGILGVLPHGAITVLVNLRARWYKFRQAIGRRSSIGERSNRNRQTECSNPPAGSNT